MNKARAMVKAIQMARSGFRLEENWEEGVVYDFRD